MVLDVMLDTTLDGFHLKHGFVSRAETVGILGASGSGKSLTLKSIAGILTPKAGRICLNDRILFDREGKINVPPRERKVGYLFQEYALFPNMTVEKNIEIVMKEKGRERAVKLKEYLIRFQIEELKNHMPGELSGGQKQRVALARMLASEPEVILLDEPFSAMDVQLKEQMIQEMKEYLKEYTGKMILVSHCRDEIYEFCEELLILNAGKQVAFGKTKQLFERPETVEAAKLLGVKNIFRVEAMDDTHVEVVDWGIILENGDWDMDCEKDFSKGRRERFTHIGIYGEDVRLKSEDEIKQNEISLKPSEIQIREKTFSYEVCAEIVRGQVPFRFEMEKSPFNDNLAIAFRKDRLLWLT